MRTSCRTPGRRRRARRGPRRPATRAARSRSRCTRSAVRRPAHARSRSARRPTRRRQEEASASAPLRPAWLRARAHRARKGRANAEMAGAFDRGDRGRAGVRRMLVIAAGRRGDNRRRRRRSRRAQRSRDRHPPIRISAPCSSDTISTSKARTGASHTRCSRRGARHDERERPAGPLRAVRLTAGHGATVAAPRSTSWLDGDARDDPGRALHLVEHVTLAWDGEQWTIDALAPRSFTRDTP